MECLLGNEEGASLAIDYAAGRLDARTTAAFESHLRTCGKCQRLTAGQQAVWWTLDEWQAAPVSAEFDQRLLERIARDGQVRWWRRLVLVRWSWRRSLPVAAACVILVAAFLLKQLAS